METKKTSNNKVDLIDRSKQFHSFAVLATDDYDLRDDFDANDLVSEMYEKGCRPFVAIPAAQNPEDVITDLSKSIITFGRAPHVPQGDYTVYRLKAEREQIKPKFTGPDSAFLGIVEIAGNKVEPDAIEPIHYKAQPEQIVEETRERLAA
jgi:hypothetical protein